MKCPKCSLQNSDTQKFCGDCGTSLSSDREGDVSRTTTIKLPAIPFPIGSTFAGRYQIIEELGKGGMGRVIRALDKKLDEEIAIKFIRSDLTEDPATVERFRIELKAARQVIHRNVARMFDLNEADGVPFITMEYVRGGDLKSLIKKVGRLDAQQAVRIVRQVAEGLAEAHRTGVIHRDLKPHNIMVDEEGTARITDFGLARLRKSDDATLTAPGMGTPAYASPEQVEGTAVDNRSDLYSLGIVLYEMLTGKIPFKGDSPYSVALQRLTKAPPDPRSIQPDIPEALVDILMKCLERERERRYQSAEELIIDLEAWEKEPSTWKFPSPEPAPIGGAVWTWMKANKIPLGFLAVIVLFIITWLLFWPHSPWKSSIAVLPIVDTTSQDVKANLPSRLHSDISLKLGTIQKLRVVPWPSLSDFNYLQKKSNEIADQLGAENLLSVRIEIEGTILKARAEWIKAKRGSLIDFKNFNSDLTDIYTLEDEIASHTAKVLHLKLNEDRLTIYKKREAANPEAINLFWEGMKLIEEKYFRDYKPEYFTQAVSLYEKAIELDPTYALAYWGLGNAYEARYNNPYIEKDPADLEMMKEYYFQAHRIMPDFAESNLGLGWMFFSIKDNISASRHFKKAYDLEPDNFLVNQDVGAFLRSIGFYDKAIEYLTRAVNIAPHSVATQNQIFSCLICLGKYKKAYSEIQKVLIRNPENLPARVHNTTALIMMNQLTEAEREIKTTLNIKPDKEMALSKALLWAAKGEKEKALSLISEKNRMNVNVAFIYIFLGMKEDAIGAIEEGIEHVFDEQGHYLYSYPMLARNPIFKPLKRERRFQEILQREKAKYEETLKKFPKF